MLDISRILYSVELLFIEMYCLVVESNQMLFKYIFKVNNTFDILIGLNILQIRTLMSRFLCHVLKESASKEEFLFS